MTSGEREYIVVSMTPRSDTEAANNLESVECFHLDVQRTRTDSAIQGHGETGRVPAGSVLAIFLTKHGGAGRAASSPRDWHPSGRRTWGMAAAASR